MHAVEKERISLNLKTIFSGGDFPTCNRRFKVLGISFKTVYLVKSKQGLGLEFSLGSA